MVCVVKLCLIWYVLFWVYCCRCWLSILLEVSLLMNFVLFFISDWNSSVVLGGGFICVVGC